MDNFPSDDPVADAAAFNLIIEDHIRKDPSQYFWVHRKFKGRPDPCPDIYENL
jgi:KDO2-lipid IV(A) lauroyltransferase